MGVFRFNRGLTCCRTNPFKLQGGHSGEFLSAQDFRLALEDAIDDIEFGNKTDLTRFWFWFAPTCAWDDFVGIEGQELGERIFERVDKWKKANP